MSSVLVTVGLCPVTLIGLCAQLQVKRGLFSGRQASISMSDIQGSTHRGLLSGVVRIGYFTMRTQRDVS